MRKNLSIVRDAITKGGHYPGLQSALAALDKQDLDWFLQALKGRPSVTSACIYYQSYSVRSEGRLVILGHIIACQRKIRDFYKAFQSKTLESIVTNIFSYCSRSEWRLAILGHIIACQRKAGERYERYEGFQFNAIEQVIKHISHSNIGASLGMLSCILLNGSKLPPGDRAVLLVTVPLWEKKLGKICSSTYRRKVLREQCRLLLKDIGYCVSIRDKEVRTYARVLLKSDRWATKTPPWALRRDTGLCAIVWFFRVYPGLRRLVGGKLLQYYLGSKLSSVPCVKPLSYKEVSWCRKELWPAGEPKPVLFPPPADAFSTLFEPFSGQPTVSMAGFGDAEPLPQSLLTAEGCTHEPAETPADLPKTVAVKIAAIKKHWDWSVGSVAGVGGCVCGVGSVLAAAMVPAWPIAVVLGTVLLAAAIAYGMCRLIAHCGDQSRSNQVAPTRAEPTHESLNY